MQGIEDTAVLRFNDIADRVLEYNPDCDLELLQRAYIYTAKVHHAQERLSGEPYLVHPLEVAGILTELQMDAVTIAAGLLHDTVEDTLATPEEIRRHFGDDVAFLVAGLTKISKVEFTSAQARQAESFRKMLVAMSQDIRILLIKLADRLHNMRTLHYLGDLKAQRIAQETRDIYVPLAHRLGVYWMKRELEDRVFRVLQPAAADELERAMHGQHVQREAYVEEVRGILSTRLGEAGIEAEVSGRQKDLASIHAKMEREGKGLDKIYDVIAFRIVTDGDRGEVYHALGLVHAIWPPVPGRFKDYVALPKQNGYQSLHTTVIGPYGERMEIQLRTRAMHKNAEYGIAAHWKYKSGVIEAKSEREFDWLRRLIERHGELSDPHEFLDVLKGDLFADEVFVFTPRGDVIDLPRGATALDFAYAVHSEIGDHCTGARVNGIGRPLSHLLRNGDTVEVRTQAGQAPKKEWLDFVVSGKARSRVRHAVRAAQQARSRELGRGIIERELRRTGLSPVRLEKQEGLAEAARRYARGDTEALFAAVGYGKVAARDVVQCLNPELGAPEQQRKPRRFGEFFRRERRSSEQGGILVGGQGDVLVRFGRCCAPLPGDEIVGFVTRGRGVTVHARDCRTVFELDQDRITEVEWDGGKVSRKATIRVTSRDEKGILAEVAQTISAEGVNIGAARIDTHEGRRATQSFDLWLSDLNTLNQVMKRISRIRGVHAVERVRG